MAYLIAYIRAHATEHRPLLPASFDYQLDDNRWAVIWPEGRVADPDNELRSRLVMRDPSNPARGLFVISGGARAVNAVAAQIARDGLAFTRTWDGLASFRADPITATLRASWPDERPRDAAQQPVGELVAHYARVAGSLDEDAER